MTHSTQVPLAAAIGLGLFGLASGAAATTFLCRDMLRTARRQMAIAIHYWGRSDKMLQHASALTTPTRRVPVVELLADPPTLRQRVGVIIDRFRPHPEASEWAEGELAVHIAAMNEPHEASAPAPPRLHSAVSDSLSPRQRDWNLFGRRPGPIPVPVVPSPFRMPQQSRPTPAMLAKLPPDPERWMRVRTVGTC